VRFKVKGTVTTLPRLLNTPLGNFDLASSKIFSKMIAEISTVEFFTAELDFLIDIIHQAF
jgi:hypothetical protein